MGKYLKKFQTHSDYENYIGGEAILPNVSICKDDEDPKHVHYNPHITPKFYIDFKYEWNDVHQSWRYGGGALWEINSALYEEKVNPAVRGNDNVEFTYEEGQTWEEWCDSEYNHLPGTNVKVFEIDEYDNVNQTGPGENAVFHDWTYLPDNFFHFFYNINGEDAVQLKATDVVKNGLLVLGYAGCLFPDTLITMSDGSEKEIKDLKVGEQVLSYDYATGELIPRTVIKTQMGKIQHPTNIYHKYTFSDGTVLKIVNRHEFYNVELGKWEYMDKWNIGDHAYKLDGTMPELVSVETVHETVPEYFTVFLEGDKEGMTNYFANGMLSGDRYCPKDFNPVKNNLQ